MDLVVQTSDHDFNLYLRSDSNTKGYCNWFFFRIKRGSHQPKSVRVNIMNLYKRSILFRSGEKPFCCFDSHEEPETVCDLTKWHTNQVTDVQYGVYTRHTSVAKKNLVGFSMHSRKQKYYCLSFTLHFLENQTSVMLCSAAPYTYRYFTDFVK